MLRELTSLNRILLYAQKREQKKKMTLVILIVSALEFVMYGIFVNGIITIRTHHQLPLPDRVGKLLVRTRQTKLELLNLRLGSNKIDYENSLTIECIPILTEIQ